MNVFDLQHDDFYSFVELYCGSIQAKILKLQLISDASTLIECSDPTEILQYNGEKLNDLKHKSCLITNDGNCIVLPGIVASFKTLKKCLLKKLEEDTKKNRKNISNNSTLPNTPIVNQVKSIDELRNHLMDTINQWFINNRADFNLIDNSTLEANTDYKIEFRTSSNGSQSAIIICGCGSKSTLARTINTGYFQASNYYRHIERCNCSTMLKKLNDKCDLEMVNEQNNSSINTSNSTTILPTSISTDGCSGNSSSKKRTASTSVRTSRRSTKRRRV
ncbi:unnamed protein product [Rotaria socialis]|nr:unnamed protein product [Rotaria socialis]